MSFHKNHWLLFGVIFFGYIGLSYLIGIGPAMFVQIQSDPVPGAQPMSDLERRGLAVYVSEGCIACHTQQVRPIQMDRVWGRPSVAGDYAYIEPLDFWRPYAPAVLGSARTGPDLSNIGSRQPSKVWHYLHMYNPRTVSPDSIMPAYPWMFEVVFEPAEDAFVVPLPEAYAPEYGVVVPGEEAQAIVAYLLWLKQPTLPESAGNAALPP